MTDAVQPHPAVQLVTLTAMVHPGSGIPVTNDAAEARVVAMMGDRLLPYVDGIRVEQRDRDETRSPFTSDMPESRDYWIELRVAATADQTLMRADHLNEMTLEGVFRQVLEMNAASVEPLLPDVLAPLLVAALRRHVTGV